MDVAERDLLVSRITSGYMRCNIVVNKEEKVFCLQPLTRQQKYISNELYYEILYEAELNNVLSNEEMLSWMIEYDIWNDDLQERYDGLNKDIEEIKVKLFQLTFNSKQRRIVRTKLEQAKIEVDELYGSRHSYDYVTAQGLALGAKMRYLIGSSLLYSDGRSYWKDDGWNEEDSVIDKILEHCAETKLADEQVRELSRTEPWSSIWSSCKNSQDAFGVFSSDMTAEQQALINWSLIYDNIKQHPDCPADDVFEDDDRLDGWLILQRRQRENDLFKKEAESKLSEKTAKAHEVYLTADTKEDAKKIDTLNEPASAMIKRQRMAFLDKKKKVHELEMPDTKLRLQTAVSQHFRDAMKRTKK